MRILRGLLAFLFTVLTVACLAYPLAQSSQVFAQSTAGNPNIGPNDAGVRPEIGSRVAGVPMVVFLQLQYRDAWPADIQKYASADPLVIRISGINRNNAQSENWTAVGQSVAAALQSAGKTGSIVIFGNELNNLEREWNPGNRPPDSLRETEMRAAAQAYQQAYSAFAAGVGGAGRVAPAPMDMINPEYVWTIWYNAIPSVYQNAAATVLNSYDAGGKTVQGQIDEYQSTVGKSPDFFSEVGLDPNDKDLVAHVQWLNSASLPAKAATLVPNHCQSGGWKNGGSIDDWLMYINGQLFDRFGALVDPASCSSSAAPVASGNPVFLLPDFNLSTEQFRQELDVYLANSQAYCAPAQVFWPERPVVVEDLQQCTPGETAPWVVPSGTNVCRPEDYPPVDVTETVSTTLSFPLFRNDGSGISVESNLSRIQPGDPLGELILKSARADFAPQFYLSSPEVQCQSAVNYIEHVKGLCAQDGFDISDPTSEDLAKCGANITVPILEKQPNGGNVLQPKTIIELGSGQYLPSDDICPGFSLDEVAQDSPRARAVAAITPYTPKVYKIGFYVQHTWLSGGTNLNIAQRAKHVIVAWFTGTDPDKDPQEKIDVVPVWYHAGLTSNYTDSNQLKPYAFDIPNANIPTSVTVPDFNRDQQTGDIPALETLPNNPKNYAGPLWQNYAFVMPQHVQEAIGLRRLQVVYQNYFLMQAMKEGVARGLNYKQFPLSVLQQILTGYNSELIHNLRLGEEQFFKNSAGNYALPFDCTNPLLCTTFRDGDDTTVTLTPADVRQTYEELAAALPGNVSPTEQVKTNLNYLKEALVARVNAGVQQTVPYDPNNWTGENSTKTVGPLSQRFLGTCGVDQANVRQGIQEEVTAIYSGGLQNIAVEDEETEPPRNPITQIVSAITAWVHGGPRATSDVGSGADELLNDRVTRSYLVLPDEALAIETMQSYIAPMFLSPEMYESIMSGTNPAYPFIEDQWEELIKNADATDPTGPENAQLSAFLKTKGPERTVAAEDAGFQRMEYVQLAFAADGQGCDGGQILSRAPAGWAAFPTTLPQPGLPSCAGYLPGSDTRLVGIDGNQPGKTPSNSVNVPGNLYALGEALRRLAFTPLHMQPIKKYEGLEKLFTTAGGSGNIQTPITSQLSEYFKTLIGGLSKTYKPVTGKQCNVAWVSAAEAKTMADPIITLLKNQEFADYLSQEYFKNSSFFPGKTRQLFGNCAGGQKCFEFIAQTLQSNAVCDGNRYLNPALAFGIAWTEDTNGLADAEGWHFGCNIAAYQSYQGQPTYNGLSCTVKTGAGHTVINPVITASEGTEISWDAYDQCVDPARRVVRDERANNSNTAEDGFGCFISVMQHQCTIGNSDTNALRAYDYIEAKGEGPITPFKRLEDFATIASRQLGQSLPDTPENQAAISQIRQNYNTLSARIQACN